MVPAMESIRDLTTSALRRRALLLTLLGADISAAYVAARYMMLHSARAFPGTGLFSLGALVDTDKALIAPFQRALYFPNPFILLGWALGTTIVLLMAGGLAHHYEKKVFAVISAMLGAASLFGVWQIAMFATNNVLCLPSMAHHILIYVALALSLFSYKRALRPDVSTERGPIMRIGIVFGVQFALWQLVWAIPFWRGILAP